MATPSITGPAQNPLPPTESSSSAVSEFKQLTEDLRSGDLSKAQADYAELAKNAPAAALNTNTPLGQAFSRLGQTLQSGDASGAKQALAAVTHHVGRHHHRGVRSSQNPGTTAAQDTSSTYSAGTTGTNTTGGTFSATA